MRKVNFFLLQLFSISVNCQPCSFTISNNPICVSQSVILSVKNPTSSCVLPFVFPANLKNGLVCYYPFCNDTWDYGTSNNNNNFTSFGTSFTTDRFNSPSQAQDFNGISNCLNTSDFCLPSNNSARTIALWFYNRGSLSTSFDSVASNLLCYGGLSTGNFFQIQHTSVSTGSNIYLNFDGYGITSTSQALYNSWQFLAFTLDATSNYSLYINGVAAGTGSVNLNTLIPNNLRLGQSTVSPNYFLNGKLDDVFIYNRALSQTEVQQLFNINLGTPNYSWSTGATTSSIIVTPSVTTTFTVNVNNGFNSCNSAITVTVSTCIGINEMNYDFDGLNIYPNPVNDILNMQKNNISFIDVEIFNSLGKNILDLKYQNTIDVSQLKPGIYYLKLITKEKSFSVIKFIKT